MRNEEKSWLQGLAQSLQHLEDKQQLVSKLSQELINTEEKYTNLKRKYEQQSKRHKILAPLLEQIEERNELQILEKMLEKQVEKEDQLGQMTLKYQELQKKNKNLELQVKRLLKLIVSLKKGEQISELLNFTDEQIMKKEGEIEDPFFYPMK